jgi:hypothetical protein
LLEVAEFIDKILSLTKVFSLEQFKNGWLIYCELYSGNKVKMICDEDNERMREHSWKMYFLDDETLDNDKYLSEKKVVEVLTNLNNQTEN